MHSVQHRCCSLINACWFVRVVKIFCILRKQLYINATIACCHLRGIFYYEKQLLLRVQLLLVTIHTWKLTTSMFTTDPVRACVLLDFMLLHLVVVQFISGFFHSHSPRKRAINTKSNAPPMATLYQPIQWNWSAPAVCAARELTPAITRNAARFYTLWHKT